MSRELASWLPSAVAATVRGARSPEPILAWLTCLRDTIEEYDPLVTVRPPSPAEASDTSTSPDSAFDEILSQLGKEIYKLDEYQRNLCPQEKEVSLSILNIFDQCLETITGDEVVNNKENVCDNSVVVENGVVNGQQSRENESTPSESFATSTPVQKCIVATSDINSIFDKGEGTPVPPRRVKLKTPSSSSSYVEMEFKDATKVITEVAKRLGSESDSESTCWSYKECGSGAENELNNYDTIAAYSSGFHNSDAILRDVISRHYATVSRLSFDTTSELTPTQYSEYSLVEVGDRCEGPVAGMTAGRPDDSDGYEPVRDAIAATDDNIYEEVDYPYTDEGCSCGGSVEVESCSMSASSEGVGRETPLYANLRDHDAYALSADVVFWAKLLLDPYYNDDEEDEWITPEECAEYTREQRPPLVIPRITTYRTPRPRAQNSVICAEDSYLDSSPPSQHYERLQDSWGPVCDRGRGRDIRNLTKPNHNLIKLDKRLGNSTENLSNSRRPQHLQIPASSSGDSLDVEVRDRTLDYGRVRNCRSMVAPKSTRKSPLPTPRQLLPVEATVVLEGPMKRTKYTENSKKSKKNWTDCYVVLTTTALYFYKDQKTYNATKVPPGTPPSPNAARLEIVLPLLNAHIVQCIQQHTRRYARSLIFTVDHQQYLIQDETEQGAKKWLIAIGETIYKLGPPGIGEFHNSHTPQYQSSNTDLESLGRTPPVSRHANRNKTKAGGSSNEDLSELQEKTQVKSKLKKLLNKRPSKDILYKKGILRDEPVFGRNLEAVCPTTSPRVPPFVVACVKEIESSEENMCTDGLYRASGNLSQVQKIRLQVDQNNLNAIAENTDIHVLAGSLKLFFRELKEPLIPFNLFDRVLKACMIKPKEARIKEFREIVQALPQCNRDTLKYLLEHLLRVTEHSEHNRMHTTNLAIVFGPTLLWSPIEKPSDFAMDCIQQNNVVDILLNDFKEIFDSKKKS